jgi:hypothetical protein
MDQPCVVPKAHGANATQAKIIAPIASSQSLMAHESRMFK